MSRSTPYLPTFVSTPRVRRILNTPLIVFVFLLTPQTVAQSSTDKLVREDDAATVAVTDAGQELTARPVTFQFPGLPTWQLADPSNDDAMYRVIRWGRLADPTPGPVVLLRDGSQVCMGDGNWSWDERQLTDEHGRRWDSQRVAKIVYRRRGASPDPNRHGLRPLVPASRSDQHSQLDVFEDRRGIDQVIVVTAAQEHLAGQLVGADRAGVRMKTDFGIVELAADDCHFVAIRSHKSPPIPHVWVGLSDGSLLCADRVETLDRHVTLYWEDVQYGTYSMAKRARSDEPSGDVSRGDIVPAHPTSIVFWQPHTSHVRYIDGATPMDYRHIPYFSTTRPLEAISVSESIPFRIARRAYRHGFIAPTASRIALAVPPDYTTLAGSVGLAGTRAMPGRAVAKIYVRGAQSAWRAAFQSGVMGQGEQAKRFSIPLGGIDTVALVAEHGPVGNVLSDVAWVDLRWQK